MKLAISRPMSVQSTKPVRTLTQNWRVRNKQHLKSIAYRYDPDIRHLTERYRLAVLRLMPISPEFWVQKGCWTTSGSNEIAWARKSNE
jgi:hypothetical protein